MARRGKKPETRTTAPPIQTHRGPSWHPATAQDVAKIADAAFHILTHIGMSDAPDCVRQAILAHGGALRDGRLLYPEALLHDTCAYGPNSVLLAGQSERFDMQVGGTSCHVGTGGAAPFLIDHDTDAHRPSTLDDLHAAARLTDALPHVDFFSRSLVAGDITDPLAFDLATATASLLGTQKHVMVQASDAAHVRHLADLCHDIAGSEAAFRARPFLSLNVNHAVPPLRFDPESAAVMKAAVRAGIPVHCNVFGQLGASSPVTMAGSVAQTLAETLAGLAFVQALDPHAPRIAGPRPMITDLRTGGMAGGAGEQATATGLATQVMRHWDLPCSVIAGATDSKLADFQAGYEKALTINTAMQAGANLITQAAGTQASLMAVSFAAMVADNDMIGALQRANAPVDVSDDALGLASIADTVVGDGHFLGRPETYARMRSDFLYPAVADRRSIEEWYLNPAPDMGTRAAEQAAHILASHWPDHMPPELRRRLTDHYGLGKGDAG